MKRLWTHAELVETFTLLPGEHDLVRHKTPPSQLAFALMLKCVQHDGRFPARPREIPRVVVQHMAAQLDLDPALSLVYEWQGRTVDLHRALIRALLGLREATTQDLQDLAAWLCREVAPQDHRRAYLIDAAQARLRTLQIEYPTPKRLARFVDSASTTFEHTFYTTTAAALSEATRQRLDALVTLEGTLDPAEQTVEDLDAIPTAANASVFYMLKQDPGALSLKTALETTSKLIRLRQVDLPPTVFQSIPSRLVHMYRDRVAGKPPREVRRHQADVRATQLACFCWERMHELTDHLVDMVLNIIHRIGARAERKIERTYLAEVKRVRGKFRLAYQMADAALTNPTGSVTDVIYPAAGGEATLRALVEEYRSSGVFEEQVQTTMRASYSRYYRRLIPTLLQGFASIFPRYRSSAHICAVFDTAGLDRRT